MLNTADGKKQSSQMVGEFLNTAIELADKKLGAYSVNKFHPLIGSMVVALTVDFNEQGRNGRLLEISNSLDDVVEALHDLRESIDFLAARPGVDPDAKTVPNHQGQLDYAWLVKLLSDAHVKIKDAAEYDEIHACIKRLAGV